VVWKWGANAGLADESWPCKRLYQLRLHKYTWACVVIMMRRIGATLIRLVPVSPSSASRFKKHRRFHKDTIGCFFFTMPRWPRAHTAVGPGQCSKLDLPRDELLITSLGIKRERRDGNVSNDVETSSPLPHQRCKIPRGHRHDQVASTTDPSKKMAGGGILEVLVLNRHKEKGKGG
jgi:hypothetical protein